MTISGKFETQRDITQWFNKQRRSNINVFDVLHRLLKLFPDKGEPTRLKNQMAVLFLRLLIPYGIEPKKKRRMGMRCTQLGFSPSSWEDWCMKTTRPNTTHWIQVIDRAHWLFEHNPDQAKNITELTWELCKIIIRLTRPLFPYRPRYKSIKPHMIHPLIAKAKKIIIVMGAGASTGAGLQDFRSKQGLQAELEQKGSSVEEIFSISHFKILPKRFWDVAKRFYNVNPEPTNAHKFVKLLGDKLQRIYTQNIDGLELKAGIDPKRIVHVHGTLSYGTCMTCRDKFRRDYIERMLKTGQYPYCLKCRNTEEGEVTGIIRPNIVFYGEHILGRDQLVKDLSDKPDLLIVIGSSLKVAPIGKILEMQYAYSPATRAILINNEVVGQPSKFDIERIGNIESSTLQLIDIMKFS